MFGTLALVAAILFVVLALARLRGSPSAALGTGVIAAAAVAAVLALVHWSSSADSRWMVGGILIAAALALSLVKANRTLAIVAVVLGVLGVALFGIATARPMHPAMSATATS